MRITVHGELEEAIVAKVKEDRNVAAVLAQQLLESVDSEVLRRYLLSREVAVGLLVQRLQREPERTVRELEALPPRADAGPPARHSPRRGSAASSPGRRRKRGRKALSFVKWVGSKASVMPHILATMPRGYGTYFEPMVGSGTVFFSLKPPRAVLCDLNAELMNCYHVIRDRLDALIEALGRHENTYEHFLEVRADDPDGLPDVERAARTIFLNKTCYNGLYRVNSSGRFNVPYGRNPTACICDEETLCRVHRLLQSVDLRCEDYARCLRGARKNDLVYLDPPYLRASRWSTTFTSYQAVAFDEDEHRRLAEVFRELDRRGCHVLLSNSNVPLVRELYRGYRIKVIETGRKVNATASARLGWDEVLVDNLAR